MTTRASFVPALLRGQNGPMKLALLSLIVLPLLAFAACGDDDSGPRPGEDTPAESPSGGATPTAAQLEQLTTTEVPGFERSESRLVAGSGSVLYTSSEKTAGGASVLVSVRLSACDPFICGTLDPKDYESADAQRNLKSILSTALIESPGLVWEFGRIELAPGHAGLFTYVAGYLETRSDSGTSRVSANGYRAWYHNRRLHILVEVMTRGGSTPQTLDEVKTRMTRTEGEKAAKEVFAAFAAAFGR